LMEARLGIPISHRPNFVYPKDNKLDFAFTPILGPQIDRLIEIMELKGPAELNLSRRSIGDFRPRFTRRWIHYDDYVRHPDNLPAVEEAFGYVPAKSKLAVLIGRAPTRDEDREIFERRQSHLTESGLARKLSCSCQEVAAAGVASDPAAAAGAVDGCSPPVAGSGGDAVSGSRDVRFAAASGFPARLVILGIRRQLMAVIIAAALTLALRPTARALLKTINSG
jgi:hypothetical protein